MFFNILNLVVTLEDKTFDVEHDYEQFVLYPFVVLRKLLNFFSPKQVGDRNALDIRQRAMSLGVFDFVLSCLSYFTHQPHNCTQLRSNSLTMNNEIVSLRVVLIF